MREVFLKALKLGLVFFMLAFAIHFIFPEELDMLTCFIIFIATGAAELILGSIKYRKSSKGE